MENEEMTYNELISKYNEMEKEYKIAEKECLDKLMSFDEMCEKTRQLKIRMYELDRNIRLLKEPTITQGKKWKAKKVTFEQFINMSLNNEIKDGDNECFYASENALSDIKIYPSDIIEDKYRKDFSYVLIF